jgi:prepilin-type processing-associated H-X9-DG protein
MLVVIAIIGILVGLMLPAVQSARESARRVSCKNNLHQLGVGAQAHVDKLGFFPSSGWGYMWTGDPDMGFGARQPGGWAYNLLPFLGYSTIHDLGGGKYTPDDKAGAHMADYKTNEALMRGSVVPIFICPTRRKVIGYPPTESSYNANMPTQTAKIDYAACAGWTGDRGVGQPSDLGSLKTNFPQADTKRSNGACFANSEVKPAQVSDGLSDTIFCAEKSLNTTYYYTGTNGSDNNSAYEGFDWALNRWVPSVNSSGAVSENNRTPMQDSATIDIGTWGDSDNPSERFGSAHTSGFNALFCDGSVHMLKYSIDLRTLGYLGCRNDGALLDEQLY